MSENTSDVKFFTKRQKFLTKQGYLYEVTKSHAMFTEHQFESLTDQDEGQLLDQIIQGNSEPEDQSQPLEHIESSEDDGENFIATP